MLGLLASPVLADGNPGFTNTNQKYNYALGQDIVSTFKQWKVDLDMDAFVAGLADGLEGRPALTSEQKQAAMEELSSVLAVKAAENRKALAAKNLTEGEAFLAANAGKEGVRILEAQALDGSKVQMQYKILRSGTGPSPGKTDLVEVHYVGALIDGTEFDSSVKRATPATFSLTDVVPGWRAVLPMMKVGDKWQLVIPPKLAYGESAPPGVGPNSTLIFEVELLRVSSPQRPDPTPAGK